jgi:hypothetical protein
MTTRKCGVRRLGSLASSSRAVFLCLGIGAFPFGCAEPGASPTPSEESVCEAVVCGEGASCLDGACLCDEGLYGDPNVACVGVASHEGWVGSSCGADQDCDYEGGLCLSDEEGFPEGYCSAPCSLYCDDQAGAPTTFCVGEPDFSDGYCLSRCDVDAYPETDGCRPEYDCVERARNTTEVTEFVCLPEENG